MLVTCNPCITLHTLYHIFFLTFFLPLYHPCFLCTTGVRQSHEATLARLLREKNESEARLLRAREQLARENQALLLAQKQRLAPATPTSTPSTPTSMGITMLKQALVYAQNQKPSPNTTTIPINRDTVSSPPPLPPPYMHILPCNRY